jgi:hypothetical protein
MAAVSLAEKELPNAGIVGECLADKRQPGNADEEKRRPPHPLSLDK